MERIVITGKGSISPLGFDEEGILESYSTNKTFIHSREFSMGKFPAASLNEDAEAEIVKIKNSSHLYKHLDRSVLLAIFAARQAIEDSKWNDESVGVNIGSSRGATETYEQKFEEFLNSDKTKTSVYTSPATTLGNISFWVMQDLNLNGPLISHSITCSTGMQAIANGMAWIGSGMCDRFLAGASEAPLTDFTIAQMRALKIYSNDDSEYPCKPFASEDVPQNRMVLGEAAAVFSLEKYSENIRNKILGEILSIGFGNEKLSSPSSISAQGDCIYISMKMALAKLDDTQKVDMILCHAPGTIHGDEAELNAIHKLFGNDIPVLASNKWKTGHTLGTSGLMSLEYALQLLNGSEYIDFPYPVRIKNTAQPFKIIMINAAGFGGSSVSLIIGK